LDIDSVAASANSRTRAVLVVNPGNPTGSFLKREELEALQRLCVSRHWTMISDEVFSDYGIGKQEHRVSTILQYPLPALSFALSGLSKVAGLPHLKLAWFCISGPEHLKAEALKRLEFILDSYLSTNTLVQRALPKILELAPSIQAQIRERVVQNRKTLAEAIPPSAPWDVLTSEGGWSSVVRMSRNVDEEQICLQLLKAGVLVQPGYFFDFPLRSFIVVSRLPEHKLFAQAVERIADVLSQSG
jgi:aspartate/methionine/tyrosine aminotransferase